MKSFLFVLALVATSSFAGDITPADTLKDARKQVEQKCKTGCIILSQEDLATLDKRIKAIVEAAQEQAFQVGKDICNRTI